MYPVLEIRMRNISRSFFEDKYFNCCPIENVWEIWLTKTDFGWPNGKIGRKWPMANNYF